MAFVPDEAIRRNREVTPSAFAVYCSHCEHRNHRTRLSTAQLPAINAETGIPIKTLYRVTQELIKKGWLEETPGGFRLLCGSFAPVDRPAKQTPEILSNENFDTPRILSNENEILTGEKIILNAENKILIPENPPTPPYKDKPAIHTSNTYQQESGARACATAAPVATTGEHPALVVLREVFTTAHPPPIFDQERIEAEVADVDTWRRVLKRLRSNGTPAKNVGTMLDVYHEQTGKGTGNGANRKQAANGDERDTGGYVFTPKNRITAGAGG